MSRRETEGQLVGEEQRRMATERPCQRQHLLLTPRAESRRADP